MGALLSIPFLAVPGITGMGGWILSCCGAAAVQTLQKPFIDNSAPLCASHVDHVLLASLLEWPMQYSFSSTRLYRPFWPDLTLDFLDNAVSVCSKEVGTFDDGLPQNRLS